MWPSSEIHCWVSRLSPNNLVERSPQFLGSHHRLISLVVLACGGLELCSGGGGPVVLVVAAGERHRLI